MSLGGFLPPLVATLEADIRGFTAKMHEAGVESEKMSKKGQGHFNALAGYGKAALLGLGTAAVGIGAASVKMAGDFQEGLTTLVTGAGEAESNLKVIRDGILSLATATGESTKQLTDGLYLIESAGYHGAQGLSVLKAAAQGAKVGNADLGTVAGAVTTVLTDYHLSASKAADVTSALVQTVASGKTHMEDLGRALGTVLPLASSLGISFPQVAGAMAVMTNAGMNARRSAMMLNNTLRSLAAPSSVAETAMVSVGLSAQQVKDTLGTKGLTGAIQLVQDAIGRKFNAKNILITLDQISYGAQKLAEHQKMSASETAVFTQALQSIGVTAADVKTAIGADGVAGAMKLVEGHLSKTLPQSSVAAVEAYKSILGGATGYNVALMLGGKNLTTYKKNVDSISGALNKGGKNVQGWALVQKDFNFKLSQAKEAVETTGIRIGTVLIPWIEKAAVAVGRLTAWFQKHTTVAKALAVVVGTVLAGAIAAYIAKLAIAAVRSAVSFTMMIAKAILWAATTTAAAIETAAAWVIAMAPMLAAAIATAVGIIVAFAPLILTLGAIGIAAYELYEHWDAVWGFIKNIAQRVWNFLKSYGLWIVAGFFGPIGIAAYALYKYWDQIWGFIKRTAQEAWDFLKRYGIWLVAGLLGPIGYAAVALYKNWDAVWGGIKAVAIDVWNGLKSYFGFYETAFKGISRALSWLVNTIWYPLWDGIRSAVEYVWSVIKPIFDAISSVIKTIGSGIGGLVHGVGGALSSVGGFLGFASGTSYAPGGTAMVGEHGPEVVHLPRGSKVTPHHAVPSGGGGGTTITVTLTGDVYGANADELAYHVADSLNRIAKNRGPILRPGVLTT